MQRFVDLCEIFVRAGHGGPGKIGFRTEKFIPKGGPDGGDGGKGGDVVFVVDTNLNTLRDFTYRLKYHAEDGAQGESGLRSGKGGEDLRIKVPPGTLVRDKETKDIICDLEKEGEQYIVCKGGIGGRGNDHFKSATNQTPRRADAGRPGEEKALILELKLVADVGLVGYPNAGKSTFLAAVSDAKPKIASYPFTTLTPNLGVVRRDDFQTFTVADIPGIIEGASTGKGLGLQFLRHIQRVRVLCFILDASDPSYEEQFTSLKQELLAYDPTLLNRSELTLFNKIDALDEEQLAAIQSSTNENMIAISALEKINIDVAVARLWEKLLELKQESYVAPE
ncbi:MAG: GTPase ObgE [Candidatus Zixiibacteriota bacterium]